MKKQYPQTASSLSTLQVDLESDKSLSQAVEEVTSKHGRLDVLINNGGASFDNEMAAGRMSMRDGFNASWNINVTGTHILTTLAVPLLLKSSDPRLIFIASGTSTLTETESFATPTLARINTPPAAGWPKQIVGLNTTSYRSSKTGLNMLMREWRRTLLNDGVKVWAVSPGFLATGLGGDGAEKLKKVSTDRRRSCWDTNPVVDGRVGPLNWRTLPQGCCGRQAGSGRGQGHSERHDTAVVSCARILGLDLSISSSIN